MKGSFFVKIVRVPALAAGLWDRRWTVGDLPGEIGGGGCFGRTFGNRANVSGGRTGRRSGLKGKTNDGVSSCL